MGNLDLFAPSYIISFRSSKRQHDRRESPSRRSASPTTFDLPIRTSQDAIPPLDSSVLLPPPAPRRARQPTGWDQDDYNGRVGTVFGSRSRRHQGQQYGGDVDTRLTASGLENQATGFVASVENIRNNDNEQGEDGREQRWQRQYQHRQQDATERNSESNYTSLVNPGLRQRRSLNDYSSDNSSNHHRQYQHRTRHRSRDHTIAGGSINHRSEAWIRGAADGDDPVEPVLTRRASLPSFAGSSSSSPSSRGEFGARAASVMSMGSRLVSSDNEAGPTTPNCLFNHPDAQGEEEGSSVADDRRIHNNNNATFNAAGTGTPREQEDNWADGPSIPHLFSAAIEQDDIEEELFCAICLDKVHPKHHAKAILACQHQFHLSCISMAFALGNREMICPLCRFIHKDQPFMGSESEEDTKPNQQDHRLSRGGFSSSFMSIVERDRARSRAFGSTTTLHEHPTSGTVLSMMPSLFETYWGRGSSAGMIHIHVSYTTPNTRRRRSRASSRDDTESGGPEGESEEESTTESDIYLKTSTWLMLYAVPFVVSMVMLGFVLGKVETLWSKISCLIGAAIVYMVCWALAVAIMDPDFESRVLLERIHQNEHEQQLQLQMH